MRQACFRNTLPADKVPLSLQAITDMLHVQPDALGEQEGLCSQRVLETPHPLCILALRRPYLEYMLLAVRESAASIMVQ